MRGNGWPAQLRAIIDPLTRLSRGNARNRVRSAGAHKKRRPIERPRRLQIVVFCAGQTIAPADAASPPVGMATAMMPPIYVDIVTL